MGQLDIWGGKLQQNGEGEVQAPVTCTSTMLSLTGRIRT